MKKSDADFPRKKTLSGAVLTADGSIVHTKLKMKSGRWAVEAVSSWPVLSALKTTLRLSGGAALGLRAEWRRNHTGSALESPASNANIGINPYLRPAESAITMEALTGSITSVTTEDSFLLTVPLAFCADPPVSFLSIRIDDGLATFGVIVEKKLEAVFSFPCDAVSSVEAAAARIRRYWGHILKRDDFPDKAFVFDPNWQGGKIDGISVELLALPVELGDCGAVKAAGAALSALHPVPAFGLPPRHGFKIHRPLLLKFSVILLCLSVITTSIFALVNFRAGAKLAQSEKSYHARLSENKALQDLNKTAEGLSAKIFAAKKTYGQSTNWGSLLSLLGEIKPNDLYLERLGSDNIQGSENTIKIALGGWSETETSVTKFISGLQGSSYITNVSLSSMERDAKNKNICRFRILCVMRLFND